uniref:Erythronate-4-phosphate dehydrogenase family protein n=1 Tax=Oryza meridionalis TaxID=40149 RepID=A0A0E0D7K7_9ORYZ
MADEVAFETARKIIMHPLYMPRSSPWLDLKVFYVRVSNCEVDESAPDRLTLNHIPLSPDTVIEVNGQRSSMHTEFISSSLRRDRVDKMTEEATFVSTDSIRMTGSVRFQVFDKNDLLLTGDLELCSANGVVGEPKNSSKRWNMKCQPTSSCNGFLKGKPSTESQNPKSEQDVDVDYNSLYSRQDFIEGEDGELSWFNAGVRVGVGIGLGICVGVGLGVGLLVRTYQSTSRNFRRRLP